MLNDNASLLLCFQNDRLSEVSIDVNLYIRLHLGVGAVGWFDCAGYTARAGASY